MTLDPPSPWLTIATVVKDDPAGFARTLSSVRAQDLDGVELLVIDSSRDRDVIPALLVGAALPQYRCSWLPPAGVYPAMNAAVDSATGDYVMFLNAGDSFAAPSVVAELRRLISAERPEWIFGRVVIVDSHGRRTVTPTWDYAAEKERLFSRGLFPAHQATVVARDSLMAIGGFDTGYRIAADYAAFLKLTQRSDPMQLDLVIADFLEGGLSTVAWKASFAEFHRARREILRPHGWLSWRERADAAVHFARVFVYREILRRGRY